MRKNRSFLSSVTFSILLLFCLFLWMILSEQSEQKMFGSTGYNSYSRQAMAWREGRFSLPEEVPYLELAVYQGQYYVSFPPLPSVLIFPLTYLYGYATPDNFLVKLYVIIALWFLYQLFLRRGFDCRSSARSVFLLFFASSLLPLTLNGAVWYHAQVLAFSLIIISICLLYSDQITLFLFLYALSVCCRPFHALYAFPIFICFLKFARKKRTSLRLIFRRLVPGLILGMTIALALGVFNYVRFGNIFEFGHNYLPEFSTQGGTQFALSHVTKNIKTFLLGLPLEYAGDQFQFCRFGYSLLIACPSLAFLFVWFMIDLLRKELSVEKSVIFFTFLLHLFCLLLHRTFGGFQLGARYAVDLIPYSIMYLFLCKRKKPLYFLETVILTTIFLFTCVGSVQVHL